jgi:hypothetical protein
MSKSIFECKIIVKTSEAGIEMNLEGSKVAMKSALEKIISTLADSDEVSFDEYVDSIKEGHKLAETVKSADFSEVMDIIMSKFGFTKASEEEMQKDFHKFLDSLFSKEGK